MFDSQGRYVIQNYQSKPPFSSFLPGIAGPLGVPVWCYYNNRGQGVCSFGGRDKDHAIMEFSPARQAYRDVARTGFRTFCKADGRYRELFTGHCDMHIGMGELEIACEQDGLRASALYFGVPGERTAALGPGPDGGQYRPVPGGAGAAGRDGGAGALRRQPRKPQGDEQPGPGVDAGGGRVTGRGLLPGAGLHGGHRPGHGGGGLQFLPGLGRGRPAPAAPGAARAGVRRGHLPGRAGGVCECALGGAVRRPPADGEPFPLLLPAQNGGAGAGGGGQDFLPLRPVGKQGAGGRAGAAGHRRGLVRGKAPSGGSACGGPVRPGVLPHSRPGV